MLMSATKVTVSARVLAPDGLRGVAACRSPSSSARPPGAGSIPAHCPRSVAVEADRVALARDAAAQQVRTAAGSSARPVRPARGR